MQRLESCVKTLVADVKCVLLIFFAAQLWSRMLLMILVTKMPAQACNQGRGVGTGGRPPRPSAKGPLSFAGERKYSSMQ